MALELAGDCFEEQTVVRCRILDLDLDRPADWSGTGARRAE
ncbi:MAG: hypothetical protein JWP01_509 [Myxococcales bacterium]|nr:hypothetical protein [Myxococcales bacterium]